MEKSAKKVKLNLACGQVHLRGFINIDDCSQYKTKPDLIADVFTLGWESETVDEIMLIHFLMYVTPAEANELFRRWYLWLKKGGKVTIETGDVRKVAKIISESDDYKVIEGNDGLMQIFGFQNTAGHKWAWCKDTLIPRLKEAGFKIEKVSDGGTHNKPNRDFTIIARK